MDRFQESFAVVLEEGVANGGSFQTVPPGVIAVLEHVSVFATGTGAGSADYFVTSTLTDNSAFREVPIVTRLGPTGAVLGSHPHLAYANESTEFGGVIRRIGSTNGRVVASFVVTGHFVTV